MAFQRTRCDGQLPCITCRNRKAFCEYKDSGRRRGPKKSQDKLMAEGGNNRSGANISHDQNLSSSSSIAGRERNDMGNDNIVDGAGGKSYNDNDTADGMGSDGGSGVNEPSYANTGNRDGGSSWQADGGNASVDGDDNSETTQSPQSYQGMNVT